MEEYMCDTCDRYSACKSGLKGHDKDCSAYVPIDNEWHNDLAKQEAEERIRRSNSMKWTTFQGRKVSLATIDHQHLSNCYWFGRIVHGLHKDDPHLKRILDELSTRFNGQLLPYRPHAQFQHELDILERMGCLHHFAGGDRKYAHVTEIWFEGAMVGEIINPI